MAPAGASPPAKRNRAGLSKTAPLGGTCPSPEPRSAEQILLLPAGGGSPPSFPGAIQKDKARAGWRAWGVSPAGAGQGPFSVGTTWPANEALGGSLGAVTLKASAAPRRAVAVLESRLCAPSSRTLFTRVSFQEFPEANSGVTIVSLPYLPGADLEVASIATVSIFGLVD